MERSPGLLVLSLEPICLYLQSTPMTNFAYGFIIICFLAKYFKVSASSSLILCTFSETSALIRYDSWFPD